MTDHFQEIYANHADRYERLVAREDQKGKLFEALMQIHPFQGATIVEFGAGTGRVTRQLSVLAKAVFATDNASAMLGQASQILEESGMENCYFALADNRAIPFASGFADIAIEGWSFGHVTGWYPHAWRDELNRMLDEMARVLKPTGTAILIETLGTGRQTPQAPTPLLAEMFAYLEQELGFQHRWIRTDYQFESVAEADELVRFFFGDAMADEQVNGKNIIVPECTGLWYRGV